MRNPSLRIFRSGKGLHMMVLVSYIRQRVTHHCGSICGSIIKGISLLPRLFIWCITSLHPHSFSCTCIYSHPSCMYIIQRWRQMSTPTPLNTALHTYKWHGNPVPNTICIIHMVGIMCPSRISEVMPATIVLQR